MKPRTGSRRFRLLLCLVIGSSIGLTAARIDLSLAPKVSAASSPQDRAAVADAAGGSLTSGPAAASRRRSAASVTFPCTVAGVTDGDTFRCAEQGADGRPLRIRLSGVAARERDGGCAPGHPCPTASADAATAELRRLASGRTLSCRRAGTTYGRVAAFCRRDDGVDLSCAMVESGTAARWPRYWGRHRCG